MDPSKTLDRMIDEREDDRIINAITGNYPPRKSRVPQGTGYNAEPRPYTSGPNPCKWNGQIVRWVGMDPALKRAVKKDERKQHAALPHIFDPKDRPKSAEAAKKSCRARALQISEHNRKCTKMEKAAKDGKLRKDGIAGIMGGCHEPFTLRLGRLKNTGYSGPELRAIRAEATHVALLSGGLYKHLIREW